MTPPAVLATRQLAVLTTQLISTLALLGLIWFVQLVHYPLFQRVPPAAFVAYETEHADRISYLVFPLMFAELLSALALLLPGIRPPQISLSRALVGATMVGLIWASTVFLQIPLHNRLHQGYDAPTIQRLVATNWLRTSIWSARAALVLYWFLHLR